MDKLELLDEIKNLTKKNEHMVKILMSYCTDEITQSEEIKEILSGLDIIEENQKIIKANFSKIFNS